MKKNLILYLALGAFVIVVASCSTPEKDKQAKVETNARIYRHIWDEILNKRRLEMFNDTNFTTNVVIHASPKNAVGIDSAKAFYANYLTGFSNIQFIQNDVFGQHLKALIQELFLVSQLLVKPLVWKAQLLFGWKTAKLQRSKTFSTTWNSLSSWG